jgi:hypothetical protein
MLVWVYKCISISTNIHMIRMCMQHMYVGTCICLCIYVCIYVCMYMYVCDFMKPRTHLNDVLFVCVYYVLCVCVYYDVFSCIQ